MSNASDISQGKDEEIVDAEPGEPCPVPTDGPATFTPITKPDKIKKTAKTIKARSAFDASLRLKEYEQQILIPAQKFKIATAAQNAALIEKSFSAIASQEKLRDLTRAARLKMADLARLEKPQIKIGLSAADLERVRKSLEPQTPTVLPIVSIKDSSLDIVKELERNRIQREERLQREKEQDREERAEQTRLLQELLNKQSADAAEQRSDNQAINQLAHTQINKLSLVCSFISTFAGVIVAIAGVVKSDHQSTAYGILGFAILLLLSGAFFFVQAIRPRT